MNLYIVTGTTKGLGAALALLIARDARNELVALARAAEGPIPGGFRIEADLADAKSLEAACDRLDERLRGKGYAKAVLINNAGLIPPVGPLDQVGAAELERNLVVNLVAPMRLMRRFLAATSGVALRRIVNISSGAARRPISGWSAYCAAKAGLDMATRVVALEAQSRGLAVEAVSLAPGVIDTGMQQTVRGASAEDFADVERFRRMKAEGVLRAPDDVAADILSLEAAGKLQGDSVLDL
ncbi:MAG: SDR family NAD(P)-dependent oxidoreductase, partial [Usitatibacter sp.]